MLDMATLLLMWDARRRARRREAGDFLRGNFGAFVVATGDVARSAAPVRHRRSLRPSPPPSPLSARCDHAKVGKCPSSTSPSIVTSFGRLNPPGRADGHGIS